MIQKTTISGFFGYADHPKWFIGHAGSSIGEKKMVKKEEIFKNLTLFNFSKCFIIGKTRGAD